MPLRICLYQEHNLTLVKVLSGFVIDEELKVDTPCRLLLEHIMKVGKITIYLIYNNRHKDAASS